MHVSYSYKIVISNNLTKTPPKSALIILITHFCHFNQYILLRYCPQPTNNDFLFLCAANKNPIDKLKFAWKHYFAEIVYIIVFFCIGEISKCSSVSHICKYTFTQFIQPLVDVGKYTIDLGQRQRNCTASRSRDFEIFGEMDCCCGKTSRRYIQNRFRLSLRRLRYREDNKLFNSLFDGWS